ncbi:citrate lyase acyl carrier protein (citrate lyase gamma chain) [Escherichia coli]|uniref:Citrate lyase acyl carrier protein (Citrate lyase gamma chain) n=1 Tax=Escherichia coli TaxID=562 RepID=A0A377B0E4_ECOLX|nr:citrate lyase acyl carrier protein (citrate lyase gamma chain) [Escherichia coli]
MKINQPAVAGTLESGDVMIRIAPLDTQDIDLQINSSVENSLAMQFAPPFWTFSPATTCAAYS